MRFNLKSSVETDNLFETVDFTMQDAHKILGSIWKVFRDDFKRALDSAKAQEKKNTNDVLIEEVLLSIPELAQAVAENFETLTIEQALMIGAVIQEELNKVKKMFMLAGLMGIEGMEKTLETFEQFVRDHDEFSKA